MFLRCFWLQAILKFSPTSTLSHRHTADTHQSLAFCTMVWQLHLALAALAASFEAPHPHPHVRTPPPRGNSKNTVSLNGAWSFAVDPGDVGRLQQWWVPDIAAKHITGEMTVPGISVGAAVRLRGHLFIKVFECKACFTAILCVFAVTPTVRVAPWVFTGTYEGRESTHLAHQCTLPCGISSAPSTQGPCMQPGPSVARASYSLDVDCPI